MYRFLPPTSIQSPPTPSRRAGLAPLEFVLCLPLLLMIMAMIIIVGTAGAWKVRTLANSRQAAARSIWPRTGDSDPKPASWWPATAFMSFSTARPDPIDADPFAQHAVVRGPAIGGQGGASLRVNTDLLDLSQGVVAGNASIDRELPLWKTLPYRNKYHRAMQFYTGDGEGGQWQFGPMGLGNNTSRRIDDLYPDYNLGAFDPQQLQDVYEAVGRLIAFRSTPDGQVMEVLDNDPELQRDFYPRVSESHCTADLQPIVDALTGQIDRMPCNLARAFLEYYQGQPQSAQNDQYIQQLEDFLMQHCGS